MERGEGTMLTTIIYRIIFYKDLRRLKGYKWHFKRHYGSKYLCVVGEYQKYTDRLVVACNERLKTNVREWLKSR